MKTHSKNKSALIKVVVLMAFVLSLVLAVAACKTTTYTVTFDTDGGGTIESQTVNQGENATKPETEPSKTGYSFTGWYKEGKEVIFDFESEPIIDNITVYAKYKANTYYIKYDKNHTVPNTGTMTNSLYTYGDSRALSSCTYTKPGYAFNGWNSLADGSGTSYTDKQSVTNLTSVNNATVTLYAQWKFATYTINYKDVGGVDFSGVHGTGYPQTHSYNTDASTAPTVLVNPTNGDCTFEGWFINSNGTGTPVVSLAADAYTDNITLFAKWSGTFDITYKNVGGGDFDETHGAAHPIQHIYGTATELVIPTKTGYTFENWYSDENGTTAVTTLSATGYTTDITLYAKWTANVLSITYKEADTNGTAVVWGDLEHPTEHTYGGEATTLVDPVKAHYTFDGWYLNKNFSGNSIETLSGTGYTDNIVLFAKWTADSYAINYRDKDGENNDSFSGTQASNNPTTHTYGTATALKRPSKIGCRFDGWFLEKDCSGTEVTTLAAEKYTDDITLYALWTEAPYTITYKEANGSNVVWGAVVHPTGHTYGEPTTLVNPTKTHYTFDGWYLKANFSGSKITVLGAEEYTDNITLFAKWLGDAYSIVYKETNETDVAWGELTHPTQHTYGTTTTLVSLADKSGYAFAGWYSNKELTGSAITTLSATGYTGTVTLYAKWLTIYTITYLETNDTNVVWAEGAIYPQTYTYSIGTTLINAAKAGIVFVGWYSDKGLTTPIASISASDSGNKTVYAKWADIVGTYTGNYSGLLSVNLVLNDDNTGTLQLSGFANDTLSIKYSVIGNDFRIEDVYSVGFNYTIYATGKVADDGTITNFVLYTKDVIPITLTKSK